MFTVYVGTYNQDGGEGLYVYNMEPSSGSLSLQSRVSQTLNPWFIALDPEQRYLYTVEEVVGDGRSKHGIVSSFVIRQETGDLEYLNNQSARGSIPCHVAVDGTGDWVLVANYGTGSIAVLPVLDDGSLGTASIAAQHDGSSVDVERQDGPHLHSVTISSDNQYVFAADLGIDKLLAYKLDHGKGELQLTDEVNTKLGAGPRHFDFHPGDKFACLINELDSTITSFEYNQDTGKLTDTATVNALPAEFKGINTCADVHFGASGKFVYGSNRGDDSMVIYEVDHENGGLSYVGHESTQGKTPRNFAIDPTGQFLIVGNEESDTVVVFRIDENTGKLTPTGHVLEVPGPACVKIVSFP